MLQFPSVGTSDLSSPPSPEKCSSLMAVACDDFSVYVVDTDTRRTVRVFTGHSNRITDMV